MSGSANNRVRSTRVVETGVKKEKWDMQSRVLFWPCKKKMIQSSIRELNTRILMRNLARGKNMGLSAYTLFRTIGLQEKIHREEKVPLF